MGSHEMAQKNDAVTTKRDEAERHESRGVVGKLQKIVATIIPPGGILSVAFNLAASSIGAGILGLPLAANSSGLVMSVFYLAIITLLTIYSMALLAIVTQRTGIRSLEGIAGALLGRWFAYIAAFVRAFHSLSGCVAYVICVGDVCKNIISRSPNAPAFLKTSVGVGLLTVVLWLCFMLPFVIPKHIDTLRYVSTFAVLFMVYFVVVIVVHSFTNGLPTNIHNVSVGRDDNADVVLFNSGNKAINGLGVFMFVYVCQINGLEVYWDMKERTIKRYTLGCALGLSLCFVLYAATAFFGYMDFGKNATKSVLLLYNPVEEPAVMVGFIGVLVKLCVSYALVAMACRNAIYHAIGWDADALPYWKHTIAVVCISIVMLLFGLFIPGIQVVLGFAGSITGGVLGFIFPALFIMYAGNWTWRKVGALNYICTYFLLLSGVVCMVFGTGATIYYTIVR